ncbi:MAG TPA: hypothetical protein VE954_40125 [Oligoflexus sp.]|uniref:hypothetical protein n=1 Tax=Oligoflexus sp. TaxID=1971216 RepID=UPI002D35D723|nr:hypothetical protein [Oligoflexus sp.]HYX39350.1 hypothetical protein [Oligoflexus sp.]
MHLGILVFCLVMMACGGPRPHEIDSHLYCLGSFGDASYMVRMSGTRHSNHECKGIGACWGKRVPWEPEILSKLSCFENSKPMEILENDICKSLTVTIVIDRNAGTARMQNQAVDKPMSCTSYTEFRDEHG